MLRSIIFNLCAVTTIWLGLEVIVREVFYSDVEGTEVRFPLDAGVSYVEQDPRLLEACTRPTVINVQGFPEYISDFKCGGIETRGRLRITPQQPSKYQGKIYVLGGSSVWGIGVANEHTVPAWMQRRVRDYKVINLGFRGVTTEQSYQRLTRLKLGESDIVVLLDGYNDFWRVAMNQQIGPPVIGKSLSGRLHFAATKVASWLYMHSNVYRSIRNYLDNNGKARRFSDLCRTNVSKAREGLDLFTDSYITSVKKFKALVLDSNAKYYHFFQPVVYTKRQLSQYEQRNLDTSPCSQIAKYVFPEWQQSLLNEKAITANDLSKIFDSQKGTVFIDDVHLSAGGNQLVAEMIVSVIFPKTGK